jgi:NTP pyrophosphatase (non-canonical NTP hydrolase)
LKKEGLKNKGDLNMGCRSGVCNCGPRPKSYVEKIENTMTSENYVANALNTEAQVTPEMIERLSTPETIRLLHAAMGLCTESGEFMDMLKKHIFYGRKLDLVNAKEEIGDSMWYVAIAIDVLKTSLDEVMTVNIDKLKERYPEKFTEFHAENRNLETERAILEQSSIYEDREIERNEDHAEGLWKEE